MGEEIFRVTFYYPKSKYVKVAYRGNNETHALQEFELGMLKDKVSRVTLFKDGKRILWQDKEERVHA